MSALGPDAFEVVEAPKGSVKRKSREKQTLESSLEAKYEQGESSGLNAASVESKTSKQSMKGNTMEPLASNFEHLDFDVAAVEATVGTQEVEQSEDGDDGFSALENELLEEMAPATLRWEKADETKKDLHGRPRLDTEAQRLRDSLASGKREEGEQLLRECAEIDQANPDAQPPRLLILVGIPGSGKTTFGRRLQEQGWERVSQDELGNRFRCEVELIRALAKGKNVVLDRCNFDEEQRYPWVRLGLLRGCHVGAIVFAVPLQQCVDRVLSRENHETLPSSPKAASIVNRFASMFRPPAQEEGISFCRYLRTEDDAERVIDEVSR